MKHLDILLLIPKSLKNVYIGWEDFEPRTSSVIEHTFAYTPCVLHNNIKNN